MHGNIDTWSVPVQHEQLVFHSPYSLNMPDPNILKSIKSQCGPKV